MTTGFYIDSKWQIRANINDFTNTGEHRQSVDSQMVQLGHTHLLQANHYLSGDAFSAADDRNHTSLGLSGAHF